MLCPVRRQCTSEKCSFGSQCTVRSSRSVVTIVRAGFKQFLGAPQFVANSQHAYPIVEWMLALGVEMKLCHV